MTKEKNKISNSLYDKDILSYKVPLYKWKLSELLLLFLRLAQCLSALKKYSNIPKALETTDFSLNNFINVFQSFYEKFFPEMFPEIQSAMSEDDLRINFDHQWADHFIEHMIDESIDRCEKDLNNTTTLSISDYIYKQLKEIDIYKQDCLIPLNKLCVYFLALGNNYNEKTEDEKEKFILLEHIIRSQVCEALGYWTAKLEEMKRGKKNVKKRTDKKDEHKAILKEMLKTMSKKKCRIKAQEKFRVTDRTILNYLKEIEDEKTTFLRKNPETA